MPPILLLSRPEPQAQRFAAQARADLPPHEALIAPLSEIAPLAADPAVFQGLGGLILTSANAVPMLPPLPGLIAWCVGPATAAAARDAGFDARDAGGDASALIETLIGHAPQGPLLHAHGKHLARDLVAALRPRGMDIRSVAVYEARALDWPATTIERLSQAQRVIAPLFSPRAADRFVRNLARVASLGPDRVIPVAISPACAARLPPPLGARCRVADRADAEGMIRALREALREALSHRGPFA